MTEDLNYWKQEAYENAKQMKINAAFSKRYEDALWDIARLLGWKPDAGCTGAPRDADDVALEMVASKLK